MKKPLSVALLALVCFFSAAAQERMPLSYFYHEEAVSFDEGVPSPESFFGFQVGEWHLTHDQAVYYLKAVAAASERVTIEEYARSYEQRPLLLLTITSPTNQGNIEALKAQRQALVRPPEGDVLNVENIPAVVWLGYGVHGNEASAMNAAVLVAYRLAADKGEQVEDMLENTVVLLDPAINPDGNHRFSTWVNMHKGKNPSTDPDSREFNELWPRGRTNHYWFDLNRDWLPVQHPESRGRIVKFQEWRPNVLTDHHEMGANSTFFFQPGVPQRTNPLTPAENQQLTGKIAKYHAEALDEVGTIYYAKESFDDFYYGKGSTYPDMQGSVGILFEQASARGHKQEAEHGLRTFVDGIRNQVAVSFSTLRAAVAMREELLTFQRDFYRKEAQSSATDVSKAYVFGVENDRARTLELVKLLRTHDVDVYRLDSDLSVNRKSFRAESSYVVPLDQPQRKLVKAAFQIETTFDDSLFYDISAWTFPYAFGLEFEELKGRAYSASMLGEPVIEVKMPEGEVVGSQSEVGYLFAWDEYYAPRMLYALQKEGLYCKVATKPSSYKIQGEVVEFDYGTILVPVAMQPRKADFVYSLITKEAALNGVDVYSLAGGMPESGIFPGSNSFETLRMPSVLLMAGDGVSGYDAGEVWHLLDERFGMPVTMVAPEDLGRVNLDRYNVLIMPSGSYNSIDGQELEAVRKWVSSGNTLMPMKNAVQWATRRKLANVGTRPAERPDTTLALPYADRGATSGAQRLGGAIFEAALDLTHPLCYGYDRERIAVFRRGTTFAEKSGNPYATPVMHTDSPLLSGYISDENFGRLKGSAYLLHDRYGRGRVISYMDNPNFRAFWYGTNKLFLNGVFFGQIVD